MKLTTRQQAYQFLNLALVVSSAYMLWKGMGVVLNTESPIVVVLTESMEPAIHRGDLLFLARLPARLGIVEIPVYKLKGREIPIVHRTIRAHDQKTTEKQFILTKGDNNQVDDRGLYNRGQEWLTRDNIMGRVYGYLPHVGMFTIIMNDYPIVKYALLGVLGIFTLTTREQ